MFHLKKNDKSEVFKTGIAAGVAEIAYVILVVIIMTSLDKYMQQNANMGVSMLAILLLLVFSAAVSGLLVFGYPSFLALQKKYHQAILTLLVTLLTLFLGFIIVLLFNFIV
jgi:uncharacterized membrane protein YbhN (UPF0104 family)